MYVYETSSLFYDALCIIMSVGFRKNPPVSVCSLVLGTSILYDPYELVCM